MFAVSALSVQNLNAQNDKVAKPAQQSINDPKPKANPQIDNEEHSPIKGENTGTVNNDAQKVNENQTKETEQFRDMQKPQGEKNATVQKQGKKQDVWEKTNKKSRPKKVKNQKMKKETKSKDVNKDVDKDDNQGKETPKPGIVKPKDDKIQKENNSKEVNKNENQGKETPKPGIVKPKDDKIQNDSQSKENKKDESSEGYGNDTQKNKAKTTLQKDEPKELPNSVARPKQKVKQGTQTQNKTNAD